ncbi:MAG TPA: hypothetical protein VG815_09050 [Chloroflexota bacterium]|nr:hypothetical protein [Chloroflexota bacterium]
MKRLLTLCALPAVVSMLSAVGMPPNADARTRHHARAHPARLTAREILARSLHVSTAAGSVEVRYRGRVTVVAAVRGKMYREYSRESYHGFLSRRNPRSIMLSGLNSSSGSIPSLGPRLQAVDEVIVGDHTAVRIGRHKWQCAPLKGFTPPLAGTPALLPRRLGLLGVVRQVRSLSPIIFHRLPVFRVEIHITKEGNHSNLPFTVFFWISKADFTLRRLVVRTNEKYGGTTPSSIHGMTTLSLSRYKVPVRIELPHVCS